MDAICIISKDQKENLDICIAYSTFGISNGNVAQYAARELEKGDELFIYLGGTGFVGIASAFSKAVKISSETHVPNWSNKSDNTPSPWTYLIPWSNYKKIDPPYELNFRNGIDLKTGVKQGWLLQSMKTITLVEKNNIKQLIGV